MDCNVLTTMLERASGMGLPACVIGPEGSVAAACGPSAVWGGVLKAPSLGSALTAIATDGALGSRLVAIDGGLHVFVASHSDEIGPRGTLCVLLPGKEESPALDRAAAEARLNAGVRAALCAGLVRHDAATLSLTTSMLSAMLDDVIQVERAGHDAQGFTSQLTGAFETIDLLFTLGRSMRAAAAPREFMTALCARAGLTLGFGWVNVCFEQNEHTTPSLRNLMVWHGDMPVDEALFRRHVGPFTHGLGTNAQIRQNVPGVTSRQSPQIVTQSLVCKGRPVGLLSAGNKHGADPMVSSYDTQLIEACAGFLGTFIENVALYDEQHELFMGTLKALTASIDAKDAYTRGHSERVAHLSHRLAQAAGLTPQRCERIRIAGLVHDVGKIGVPEAVLTKPARLTDEEFAFIKRHPEIGHTILRSVTMLSDVLPGVLHHHERFDGRGYPHGLAGDDIPYFARVIAVADTFDAMSSDRSYRKRLSREQVLAEIAKSAGTQLDPEIAAVMLRLDLTEYDALVQHHAGSASAAAPAPAAAAA